MLMSCFDLSYFIVFVVYLGLCITFIMFIILVFFTWCRLCTITATDTVTMAIDSTRSTTTMILKSRRLVDVLYYSHNLFNVTNFHLTKKLSCSKTRWQVKKINYSIVSTKYWFCITYCSTNRTTIQLFYVWWIHWSVIGCNLTFTCKKKKPFYLPVLTKEVTLIFDFILNARIYHHHSYESSCFSFQWL